MSLPQARRVVGLCPAVPSVSAREKGMQYVKPRLEGLFPGETPTTSTPILLA